MAIAGTLALTARIGAATAAFVAALSLLLMMAQTVLDVVLRWFFNSPIDGNLEIVSYYHMVAVVFLPLALVELKHEHISVDVLVARLSRRSQNLFYVFAELVGLAFLAMLFYRTLLDALHSTQINEVVMGSATLVVWPAKWALPIGFGAMILAVAANAAMALNNLSSFEAGGKNPAVD